MFCYVLLCFVGFAPLPTPWLRCGLKDRIQTTMDLRKPVPKVCVELKSCKMALKDVKSGEFFFSSYFAFSDASGGFPASKALSSAPKDIQNTKQMAPDAQCRPPKRPPKWARLQPPF